MDSELLKAYKNTDYLVMTDPEIWIRIGEPALGLRELNSAYTTFCIITAYNPKSVTTSDSQNLRQNQRLLRKLRTLPNAHLCGRTVARDPDKDWPDERGFLVANLIKEDAIALGQAFSQHALVWLHEPGFRAELLMCDEL